MLEVLNCNGVWDSNSEKNFSEILLSRVLHNQVTHENM